MAKFNAYDKPMPPVKRILLDGEDVTKWCFEADTEVGYIKRYTLNENGKPFVAIKETDGSWKPVTGLWKIPGMPELEVAWEELRGEVAIEMMSPAEAEDFGRRQQKWQMQESQP